MGGDRLPKKFYDALGPSRFDGKGKNFTEDCEKCDFYRYTAIGMERRLSLIPNVPGGLHEHRCYWGAAIEGLWEVEKGKVCVSDPRKSPRMKAFNETIARDVPLVGISRYWKRDLKKAEGVVRGRLERSMSVD